MLTAAKIILVILCVLLITVILFQSGRSAGLSGVISGGADQSVNRKSRGLDSFLAKVTVVIAVLFFAATLFIAYMFTHTL